MPGVEHFVSARQPLPLVDPRRQAIGNQLKFNIPAAKLGDANLKSVTHQPSHDGRPNFNQSHHAVPQFAQTVSDHGDAFDTDAEGIEDTTITSFGDSSSNDRPSGQRVQHQKIAKKAGNGNGNGNGHTSRAGPLFVASHGQIGNDLVSAQREARDVEMEEDDHSFEESEDEETRVSRKYHDENGEEDEFSDEEESHEYPNTDYPDYVQVDYQKIAESPTMQRLKNPGSRAQNTAMLDLSQMDIAQKMEFFVNAPADQDPIAYTDSPHQTRAVLPEVGQARSNRVRLTPKKLVAVSRQVIQPVQQIVKQGLKTPPPTSSKSAATQMKLETQRQAPNPPSIIVLQPPPSLPQRQAKSEVPSQISSAEVATLMDTRQDMKPSSGFRKSSPELLNHGNGDILSIGNDEIQGDSEMRGDQLHEPSYYSKHAHPGNGADKDSPIALSEDLATRKRDKDLDYSPEQLSTMSFEQLASEPFNEDPKAPASLPPENITRSTLAEKLDHILKLRDHDNKDVQRKAILSSLPIEEYKECGELIIGKFGNIISKFSDTRQQRRDILIRFEAEVARREALVKSKTKALEKDLNRLKRGGEDVVRGQPDE